MVQSSTPVYFYQQDFFIEDGPEDLVLHLSIFQKFTDNAMVDFIVEILDYEASGDLCVQPSETPVCDMPCFIGGQKAFNEFHNYFELGPRTLFRLWLFKHSGSASSNTEYHSSKHSVSDCGKFQMQLEFSKAKPKSSSGSW